MTTEGNSPLQELESLPKWAQLLIQELRAENERLSARVQELEAKLAKNSSNSGKPPSSDGLSKINKNKGLRGKSERKAGGQVGRKGTNLKPVENPDIIKVHTPKTCQGCQISLKDVAATSVTKRQVFDIPPISVIVTEHQAETKICPCCGTKNQGEFPKGVNGFTQYGERVQAFAAYLLHHQMLPFDRVAQLFDDLFNIPLSPGTCSNIDKRLFKHLEPFEVSLIVHLLACKVLHLDETGVRCNKKLHWIHVTSSETATFFGLHANRGKKAIDEIGILPKYGGNVVHDHLFAYFLYHQAKHSLCNVHHLRELKFVHEEEKSHWAKEMTDLLLKGKKMGETARAEGLSCIDSEQLRLFEEEYRFLLLKAGSVYVEAFTVKQDCRSVGKQGVNLFKRLLMKMDCVLNYMRDLSIPFSNNLAEQDLRMEKVKQKVSGCFRTDIGGKISCRIRSYISTARKQGWDILDALSEAVSGFPRLLVASI